MLSIVGIMNLKNTFNWLLGASETLKIKPEKASGPLFHPVIPPKHISKVLQGFKWSLGHPTMLILSVVGHTNTRNTLNLLSRASETMKMDASSILTNSTMLVWPKTDNINIVVLPGGHLNPCSTLGMYFWKNNWVKHGSIYLVFNVCKNQLKMFLGLVWPRTDSINIVGWPWDHLNPCSTLVMHFVWIAL